MTDKLNKEELLEHLSDWYEYSRIEKALNVIYKTDEQAYQQIKATITKFDEECEKSFDAGYKAGLIEKKPQVTEEWKEEKAKDILKLIGYKIHGEYLNVHIGEAKDFISLIVKEIHGKR